MIELDDSLPSELVPLSWLLGVWEGSGVVNYAVGDEVRNHEFGQRLSFSHDGLPYLNYTSYTWLLNDELTPLATETGYWRVSRVATEGDPGPGMLPGVGVRPFSTAASVETLRNAAGGRPPPNRGLRPLRGRFAWHARSVPPALSSERRRRAAHRRHDRRDHDAGTRRPAGHVRHHRPRRHAGPLPCGAAFRRRRRRRDAT